jgi:hypothetical protein
MIVPELEPHCKSWIISDQGVAVIEAFDREYVETIAARDLPGVQIWTALAWLCKVNSEIRRAGRLNGDFA